ncbi:helix-turn-helix transcriptional regulator [Klebsiella sp. BIGb0407]|uniref:AraC family transcriptional regulator n=1 Tax=Klebsiella sp. BIGb0407 TaxID=2940603 RepID=UPI002166C201|nr:helix-turn-helix transcriptional regulator [Klebsiella sp. BIGb0407]MCS3429939.1 AraC-like DNA-binding protein [Klebsiella sp. BIGb0407]
MVKIRHFCEHAENMPDVIKLDYEPAGSYSLDIEIFSVSSLRKRVSQEQMQLPHQYAFGMLLLIVEGECTHWIDFLPVSCRAGSLMTLSPGQVHQYGNDRNWEGWIMLLRSEFISTPASIRPYSFNFRVKEITQNIPHHIPLDAPALGIMTQAIEQMREDAALLLPNKISEINALLHHQFIALLLRLSITCGQNRRDPGCSSNSIQRFNAFKDLVEKNYAKKHQVTWYANTLACSEKSLNLAAVEATGMTAKNIITSRINLEAKRLLANSTTPVVLIAEQLGFEESTNFVKFFKRYTSCTPGEFRKQQRGIQAG